MYSRYLSFRLPSSTWTPWSRFLVCCYAVIFGLRAFVIARFGAGIPWVDEWQATGQEILLPWSNGTLTFAALFEAHNGDHRIVATRLWEIFWYEMNGAWDPKLLMIAKAAIFATAATVFIHLLARAVPSRRYAVAAVLALLFAFPFSFHNLLWAFQSQFDFFLLGVALGWLAMVSNRPLAALLIAMLSLFTLGAGPILAASYVPFAVWAWVDKRWSMRQAALVVGAAITLAAVGASLRAEHAAPLGTPGEQTRAVTAMLAWPHSTLVSLVDRYPQTERLIPRSVLNFPTAESSWFRQAAQWLDEYPVAVPMLNTLSALVLLAPTAIVLTLVLRRRIRGAAVWGALGLGGFALLMQIATGIARAQEVGVPVRYLDVVSLSLFAALACAWVIAGYGVRARRMVAVWGVFVAPACLAIMVGTMATLGQRRSQVWVENVRQYFPSHDHAIFHAMVAKDPDWALPFISRDIDQLMAMLDDPAYEAIVPRTITAPDEPPRPIARVAGLVAAAGGWIALLGAGAGAWIAFRVRRRDRAAVKLGPFAAGSRA